jgi:hypothetical protein
MFAEDTRNNEVCAAYGDYALDRRAPQLEPYSLPSTSRYLK